MYKDNGVKLQNSKFSTSVYSRLGKSLESPRGRLNELSNALPYNRTLYEDIQP